MTRIPRILTVIALTSGLALTACGGDDDDTPAPGTQPGDTTMTDDTMMDDEMTDTTTMTDDTMMDDDMTDTTAAP